MCHCPIKRRRSHPTNPAQQFLACAEICDAKSFAANSAQATRLFRKIFPTGIADRNSGDVQKRFAAKAA
jgi:hypothetical protein